MRLKKMIPRLGSVLLICLLGFTLAACSNNSSNPPGDGNAENITPPENLTKITVSEPVRSELWGPVYMAQSLGFFAEEGLDVEFVTVQGDMPTAPVLSGDAQFGLYGPEMIMRFNEQGQGTKLLLTVSDRYPYSFVTATDITSIAQLKDSIVCAADTGSSPRAFVRSILASAGLDPDKDANYVHIPGAASIAALESGEIKGTYVSPTARKIALESGFNLLIDIYDDEVHRTLLNSDSYEMYIVFATDDYIAQNPQTVQAFSNGVYKALLWADSHSTDEIAEALKPLFTNSDTLLDAVKEIKDNDIWSNTGTFSEDGFAAIANMAIDSGLITNVPERNNVISEEFILNSQKALK